MASLTLAITEQLAKYVRTKMPELQAIYLDFPAPSDNLLYPCMTIFQNNPTFTNRQHYVIYKGAKIETGPDSGKYPVLKVVGTYDWTMQLDLWARNKQERHTLYEKLFIAFNSGRTGGINLQLVDYYNTWASYCISGLSLITDEAEAQRGEWRAKVTVLGNCYAIVQSNEFLMETIENSIETPDAIAPPEEPSSTPII